MIGNKAIGVFLLVLSIISPLVFFAIASLVGESSIFGIGGIVFYSWIIYFAAIVAAISLIYALIAKKNRYRYKKNVIVSSIIIPLCLIFGSYRLIFADSFDYSNQIVVNVNKKTGLFIPENEKIVTQIEDEYLLGNEKIVVGKKSFEATLKYNWKISLSASIKNVLPYEVSARTTLFDYYLFYDCDTNAFNEIIANDAAHSCVFLAYNISNGRLMLLDEYLYES